MIHAGSQSGRSDLATVNTSSAATTYSASGVAAGTYYVRMLASNANGQSGPSNEIVVTVGGTPPSTPCLTGVFGRDAVQDCVPTGRRVIAGVVYWNPNPCDYPSELWRLDLIVETDSTTLSIVSPQVPGVLQWLTRVPGTDRFSGILDGEMGVTVRGRCYESLRRGSMMELTYNGNGTWSAVITITVDEGASGVQVVSIGRATLR